MIIQRIHLTIIACKSILPFKKIGTKGKEESSSDISYCTNVIMFDQSDLSDQTKYQKKSDFHSVRN